MQTLDACIEDAPEPVYTHCLVYCPRSEVTEDRSDRTPLVALLVMC